MKIFFFVVVLVLAQMTFAQSQNDERLAVYLLPGVKAAEVSKLDLTKLKTSGSKVFDQDDILHYRLETHEFRLEYAAGERIRKDTLKLRGKPFAVFVGKQAVYAGAFWTSIWSQSFDGVFIDLSEATKDYPLLTFRDGYPNEDYFTGTDRRADPRILKVLEKSGQLYDELQFVVKCKNIVATGKRRASFEFTFDVVAVTKGKSDEKELTLELYDGKLLPELGADFSMSSGKELQFNREQEIVLNFITQRGAAKPDRMLIDFSKK